MQMGLLPDARSLVAGEAPLRCAKLSSMHAAATALALARRNGLVEHLVEDDQLDEVARHPLVVEGGVDADELLLVKINAHLDGAATAARRAASPADARRDLALELLGVQLAIDLGEIVDAAAGGDELLRPLRQRLDQRTVRADVRVDDAGMGAPGAAGKAGHGAQHLVWRDAEHMVQTEAEQAFDAPVRDHGPGVVGHLDADRLAQELREPQRRRAGKAGPLLGRGAGQRLRRLWFGHLDESRAKAGCGPLHSKEWQRKLAHRRAIVEAAGASGNSHLGAAATFDRCYAKRPMISFAPEEEERLFQETARAFAHDKLRAGLRTHEAAGALPPEVRTAFHELGLSGLDLPEALGFGGLSLTARALIEEELAAGDLGAAFALDALGLAGQLVRELGTQEQQARLLKPFLDQPLLRAAFCAAEKGAVLGCTATRDGDHFRLDGEKHFALGAADAELLIVLARPAALGGLSTAALFAVQRSSGGVTAAADRHTLGFAELPACKVSFSGARGERLGEGEVDLRPALRAQLLRAAAVAAARGVGCARAAFEHARKYAEERTAFGKQVSHFQAVAFLLADMATELDGVRALVWRACRAWDKAAEDAPLRLAQAAAQAREACAFITNNAVQILGGAGFVQDHPAEKWMRDARQLALYAMPAEAANALAASWQLGLLPDALPDDELFCFSGLQSVLT